VTRADENRCRARVDPIAVKSGIVVDEHGRKHEINAGKTGWERSSSELRNPLIAAHFGLSRADAPTPGSRPSWYLD
jgi:hypothetical protein